MNDQGVSESWDRHVTDWEENIWPVMKRHNITKSAAFVAWMLHRVDERVAKAFRSERRSEGDEWRGERSE